MFSEENKCQPNPCQNDGICNELTNGEFECTCKKGYFGDKCQGKDQTLRYKLSHEKCFKRLTLTQDYYLQYMTIKLDHF